MSSGSKGRRPRKGSLAWYHNSSRGIPAPSVPSKNQVYFEKLGMDVIMRKTNFESTSKALRQSQEMVERITPVTILKELPFDKHDDTRISFNLPSGKPCIREAQGRTVEDDWVGKKFTVIAYNKCRGILGPVARRGVKLGKRKAIGAGVSRHAGCMGCRQPGKTSWRKAFMGRHGGNRRTIRGNLVLRILQKDSVRYILLKGSVPGKAGSIVCLK